MRVALFTETYFPYVSGVVTHVHTLKQEMEAQGHEVLVVTLSPKARRHIWKDGVLYCPAVSLKSVHGFGVSSPKNLRRLSLLRRFNPDIIHIHTEFSMGIFGLHVAKQLDKPVVYTLHTMYDEYVLNLFPERMDRLTKPAAHAYIRNVASKATEIIGPSVKVVEYLRQCGVDRHINIVADAIDTSNFAPGHIDKAAVQRTKQELGINPDDVALCWAGRLGKEKSVDMLIRYFWAEFADDKRFKLLLFGDGPQCADLQALVATIGAEEQIIFTGQIPHAELPLYFAACNMFVSASVTDISCTALLEANASGLYAANRLDIYNPTEIQNGKNGELWETQAQFAGIIQRYAELSEAQRTQRRDTVSAFAAGYGPAQFVQNTLNVYQRALAGYYGEE